MGFKRDSRFAFSPSPGVEDRCKFQIKKWGGLGGKEGIMALAKKENHKKFWKSEKKILEKIRILWKIKKRKREKK